MADSVQFQLELTLPQIKSLREKGIFAEEELKKITDRRKNFEYKIKGSKPLLEDWLEYIAFEEDIHALIKLRLRLKISKKKKQKKAIKTSSQARNLRLSQEKRIHGLYRRALKIHGNNASLWLQYITRCQNSPGGGTKSASIAFAKALQYHPLVPTIWLRAAFWEYSRNMNINAGRSLMQRSIRMMPDQLSLWHGYFRLELLYIDKIRKRMEILGLEESALNPRNRPGIQLEKETNKEGSHIELPQSEGTKNEFLNCGIPKAIVKAAIKEHPNDFDARLGFLSIYREFRFTNEAISELIQGMETDFPFIPEMYALKARLEMLEEETDPNTAHHQKLKKFKSKVTKAIQIFDQGIQKIAAHTLPSSKESCKIWSLYIDFYEFAKSKAALFDVELANGLGEQQLGVFKKGTQSMCEHGNGPILYVHGVAKFYERWIEYVLEKEKEDVQAAIDISKSATDILPSVPELWILRMKLFLSLSHRVQVEEEDPAQSIQHPTKKSKLPASATVKYFNRNECIKEIVNIFASAFEAVEKSNATELWIQYLGFILNSSNFNEDDLRSQFKKALLWGCDDTTAIKCDFISKVSEVRPIESCREFYELGLKYPPVHSQYLETCLDIENKNPSNVDVGRIRKILEQLCECVPPDLSAFTRLYELELLHGSVERAANVKWKAGNKFQKSDVCAMESAFMKVAESVERTR